MLKVGIIGTGAVATALGSFLQGHDLFFFDRNGSFAGDLTLVERGLSHRVSSNRYTTGDRLDCCFVCTKAFDVKAALGTHSSQINVENYILLCNGWLDQLVSNLNHKYLGKTFRQGVCFLGATKMSRYKTELLSNKSIIYLSTTRLLVGLKSQRLQPVDNFVNYRDEKFFYNLVLNTMTACYRYPYNGRVLNNLAELREVAQEAYGLLMALTDGHSKAFSDFEDAERRLTAFTRQVYENQNSMYQDVEKRRATESSFLAGLAVGRSGFAKLKSLHSYLS